MLQVADLKGDERVLDAGCGAGHTALAFAPHVAEVVAMDLSDAMLEQVALLAAERRINQHHAEAGRCGEHPLRRQRV